MTRHPERQGGFGDELVAPARGLAGLVTNVRRGQPADRQAGRLANVFAVVARSRLLVLSLVFDWGAVKTDSEFAEIQAAVYEDVPKGWRVDVLGRQLVVNPPASPNHNRIARLLDLAPDTARPAELAVSSQGDGFYAADGECWVPDMTVFRASAAGLDRYRADDLVLAVEVLSPSNRHGGYLAMLTDRQSRFRCGWLAVVDPEAESIAWYDETGSAAPGPQWAGGLHFPSR